MAYHNQYRGYSSRPPAQPVYSGYPQYRPQQQQGGYQPPQRGGYAPPNTFRQPNPGSYPQPRMPQPQPPPQPRPTNYPPNQQPRPPYPSPVPQQPQPAQPTSREPVGPGLGSRKQSLSDLRIDSDKIKSLSVSELKEIQDNEEKFLELFTSLQTDIPNLVKLKTERERALEENRVLATKTLEKEPQISDGLKTLVSLTEEQQVLQGQYRSVYDRMVHLISKFELAEMRVDLQKLSTQAEEEGESLVDNFLSGKTSDEEFRERYFELRKIYWLRKVKLEKLEDLEKKRPAPPVQTGYIQPVPYPPGGGGAPVPYPRRR